MGRVESFEIDSPWSAPAYRVALAPSTQDLARALAAEGAAHGSVVVADEQSAGRGRVPGRAWHAERGESLLCTVLLRFASLRDTPRGLTVRVGLAAAEAAEEVVPELRGRIRVKWPNDLLVVGEDGRARKLCGVLCEGDGKTVLAGIGLNVSQAGFPAHLAPKATSLAREAGRGGIDRFELLEALLRRLAALLGPEGDALWRRAAEARLHRLGETVEFEEGAADSGALVRGRIAGLGEGGELVLEAGGALRHFSVGELRVYWPG